MNTELLNQNVEKRLVAEVGTARRISTPPRGGEHRRRKKSVRDFTNVNGTYCE
jgi:hypothetical protein